MKRPHLCESCAQQPASAVVGFPGSTVEPFLVCVSCAPADALPLRVEQLRPTLRLVTA